MNNHVITLYNIKRFTDQCFDRDNDKMVSEGINFVIRLKAGNKPKIVNETGERISLLLSIS